MPVSAAQKKASIKYLEKLDEVRIRMEKGKKADIKAVAEAAGESMNQYIINAVDQRMNAAGGPQEAVQAPEAGAVSLPPDTLKTAQGAAEAAEEGLPQFVIRAVETQAQVDKIGRDVKESGCIKGGKRHDRKRTGNKHD
ncbi:MAG: hypothetical protein NC489_45460 [Ruminococcus flavefaciens]|nr:hypothetical protein [Ruminococcus flavefaciens]